MSEWRKHADLGQWRQVDPARILESEWGELVARLKEVVPKTAEVVGMEGGTRYCEQGEISRELPNWQELRAAAVMLQQMGPLVEVEVDWRETARSLALGAMPGLQLPPKINGRLDWSSEATPYSKEWHVRWVLELLRQQEVVRAMALREADPADREFIESYFNEVTSIAFEIGLHVKSALGKEHEFAALVRYKALRSAQASGFGRKGPSLENQAVLKKMAELIREKHVGVRAAAEKVAAAGFGRSAAANAKAWSRYRRTLPDE